MRGVSQKLNLEQFDYSFPKDLIAQAPAKPRDSARLLVYNRSTGEVSFDTFLNLPKYLPPQAVLVFNETKVIPARFTVTKPTGGICALLYLSKVADQKIKVLSDKKLTVGSNLKGNGGLVLKVEDQNSGEYILSISVKNFEGWLARHGVAPLPPYIKNSPLSRAQAKREYQTIFANIVGSVAAPTASLHFTNKLLKRLEGRGIRLEFVTLHVGLGTFAKVTDENLKQGKLHGEQYEISSATAKLLTKARKEGRPIIAVGTTVVRTLESYALRQAQGKPALHGNTDLFIRPGFDFKFVDGMITNFHVPRSSLMMLVSALTGRQKLLELYRNAIDHRFRLFSFGDGMLVL